jgi:hypothetical protein
MTYVKGMTDLSKPITKKLVGNDYTKQGMDIILSPLSSMTIEDLVVYQEPVTNQVFTKKKYVPVSFDSSDFWGYARDNNINLKNSEDKYGAYFTGELNYIEAFCMDLMATEEKRQTPREFYRVSLDSFQETIDKAAADYCEDNDMKRADLNKMLFNNLKDGVQLLEDEMASNNHAKGYEHQVNWIKSKYSDIEYAINDPDNKKKVVIPYGVVLKTSYRKPKNGTQQDNWDTTVVLEVMNTQQLSDFIKKSYKVWSSGAKKVVDYSGQLENIHALSLALPKFYRTTQAINPAIMGSTLWMPSLNRYDVVETYNFMLKKEAISYLKEDQLEVAPSYKEDKQAEKTVSEQEPESHIPVPESFETEDDIPF